MPFLSNIYSSIQNELASNEVTIIAVSKTKPVEDLMDAYQAGVRDFGENYVQELVEKNSALPNDIRWHFIGHLQTNKVKYIAPFVHLIQGVDSEKLLLEINKQGKKINRKINCLLQIYIAKEETKFGMDEAELNHVISLLPELEFVNIQGVMGMASFSDNPNLINKEFKYLHQLYQNIKQLSIDNLSPKILSMGMSADYRIAVDCGSNMIRIGSMLFGERNYNR